MCSMRIVAYSDGEYSSKISGLEYIVMLNPESLKWGRSIEYSEIAPVDASAVTPKFNKTLGESLSFDIVIDCTGVVDSKRVDLPGEIKKLADVVYTYNGKIHRPNFVGVFWGKGVNFKGVLNSFDSSYTYFRSDGTPLRAKVSLNFTSYIDPKVREKLEGKESPDISHHVTVVDGDSLPGISQKLFDSPNYYIQIAKANKLNKFRQLKPGIELTIPPIINSGALHESN